MGRLSLFNEETITTSVRAALDVAAVRARHEQWGVCLEGEWIRIQDGVEHHCQAGDFWGRRCPTAIVPRAGPVSTRPGDTIPA